MRNPILYMLKELYSCSLKYLAQFWKHAASYLIPPWTYKYEGPWQSKSAAGKIIMLKKSLEKVMIFKAAFLLVFHRKLVKQRYVSSKRNIDLQQ